MITKVKYLADGTKLIATTKCSHMTCRSRRIVDQVVKGEECTDYVFCKDCGRYSAKYCIPERLACDEKDAQKWKQFQKEVKQMEDEDIDEQREIQRERNFERIQQSIETDSGNTT